MSYDRPSNREILDAVQALGTNLLSLTHLVNRIDQRLVEVEQRLVIVEKRLVGVEQHLVEIDQRLVKMDKRLTRVEKQTALIPGMVKAIANFSGDLDNHEKRLKNLEGAMA